MLHNKAKALNRLGYRYWLIILQPTSAVSEQIKCWGIRMDVEGRTNCHLRNLCLDLRLIISVCRSQPTHAATVSCGERAFLIPLICASSPP